MTWSPGRTWAESERLVGRAAPGYGWRGSRRWVLRGGIRHARRALSQRLSRSRDDAGAPPALGERKRLDDALAVGAVVPLSLFLVSNLSGLRCLQRSESAPSAPLGVPFLGSPCVPPSGSFWPRASFSLRSRRPCSPDRTRIGPPIGWTTPGSSIPWPAPSRTGGGASPAAPTGTTIASRTARCARSPIRKGGPPVRVVTNNGPFHISER